MLHHSLQAGLLSEAKAFREANTVDVTSYEELQQAIEQGERCFVCTHAL